MEFFLTMIFLIGGQGGEHPVILSQKYASAKSCEVAKEQLRVSVNGKVMLAQCTAEHVK